MGMTALRGEIDRARREKSNLILGFVDVDQLKAINDGTGHAAGDALLVAVANALRAHTRSYEPIVRVGGDEFVCALSNVDLQTAKLRFDEIRAVLADNDGGGTISIGLAQLDASDDLETLIARADAALISSRESSTPDS